MLKRLGPSVTTTYEATTSALFGARLEFNPPAHGVWNIVHVGMLVPEAHQIYVCAVNCMRGVVLTAAEMGESERFSCVVLKESDIVRGTGEQVTLDGVADVLRKLEGRGSLPPCVIVFPVCTHHFLGVSMARVYRELRKRFPDVDFVEAFMDPIMKRRMSPDVRLRKAMYDPLEPCEEDPSLVALLGSDFSLDEDCDLRSALAAGGYSLVDVQGCKNYAEFKRLAAAGVFVTVYPNAVYGAQKAARRLGRRHVYVPSSFDYAEIAHEYEELRHVLHIPAIDHAGEVQSCEEALVEARDLIGDAPIAIDASLHPRPLGLARLLLQHGLRVTEVYLDGVSDEERTALEWLRKHAPSLQLSSVVLPELRVAPRIREQKTLALGQKAAWFCGTPYFVNLVEGGGLWGYAGIRSMARLMCEAWETPKDTRDLVPRKGLGCASCF